MAGATRRTAGLLAAAGLAVGLAACSDGGGLTVPVPTAEQRSELVAQLAQASKAQGICYGWRLEGTGGALSQGSNLGDDVPVDSESTCRSWVEVRASVSYVSDSSEAEDSAYFEVATSPELTIADQLRDGLSRFGVDEDAFVDDPALAISVAALSLPLLTAESGAAKPAPTPSAAPAAQPRALEQAGGDFWRDRWVFVLVTAGIVVVAGLTTVMGLLVRRRRSPRR